MSKVNFNINFPDFYELLNKVEEMKFFLEKLKNLPPEYEEYFQGLCKQGFSMKEAYDLLKETFKI